MRFVHLSKASWRASSSWVHCSRLAVRPPRGLHHARRGPFERVAILPQACTPLQSVTRDSVHQQAGASALTRFPAPSAQPNRTSHHSRGCLPRVLLRPRTSRVPRRLAPETVSPACLNRARSRGSALQSLTRQGSPRLSALHPLLRLAKRHSCVVRRVPNPVRSPRSRFSARVLRPGHHRWVGRTFPFGSARSVPDRRRTRKAVAT
jgi:hypothetical protein